MIYNTRRLRIPRETQLGGEQETVQDDSLGGVGFFQDRIDKRDAAALEAAEAPYKLIRESQRKAQMRKGRRASILTSPQGVVDPIGTTG